MKVRQGVVTLAIGDGANDESMILEANVGVGITGVEGTAASRASAFAIGQFRFLHTLLFVHGFWSYRRMAKLVPYMFYKSIIVIVPMLLFGFFSGFSGQQFVNDYIYLFHSVIYTATPVMVLAIIDRGMKRDTLENNPLAYASVLGNVSFNRSIFYTWIARALIHGSIIFFIIYGTVHHGVIHLNGKFKKL